MPANPELPHNFRPELPFGGGNEPFIFTHINECVTEAEVLLDENAYRGSLRSHTSPGRMPGSRRRRSVFGSTWTLLDDASSGGYRTSHSNPRRNHMDSEYSCSSPASYR